jgi:formamidase
MQSVEIDRGKRLRDQPGTGHNRFHPDVPPIVTVAEGEEVILPTRDGVDGQFGPGTTEPDMNTMQAGAIHPLTGPVFVKGAQPGDVLEVEFVDIAPQPHAFTAILPGLGFLRDVCTTPFLVHWQIRDGWATSPKLPGVRIPGAPFMGVSGVAPSAAQVRAWAAREADLLKRGGMVFPPDADGAVPSRRSEPGAGGHRGAAHAAATRERRQLRRQAADQGLEAPAAGRRRGRAVLDRRRAFRAG